MIKRWLLGILFVTTVGGMGATMALPTTASAAIKCDNSFLTFPPWYRGLTEIKNGQCNIKAPAGNSNGLSKFIWTIVLNVIEIALQLVGYISVAFIIYGGFTYIVWAGASDRIANARKMILNAVAGLVISLFAVAVVNLIASSFNGGNL
jgi:hypothetical protein